jgi:galactitol-specific phosphotransferase system IIB component
MDILIRNYTQKDYNGALAVMQDAYAGIDDNYGSADDLKKLADTFPEGQLVAVIGNEVVGLIFSLLIDYKKATTSPTISDFYNPATFASFAKNGNSLFALEILVKSTHKRKGIGKMLNEQIKNIMQKHNLKAFVGVSRMAGYGEKKSAMDAATYIEKVKNKELQDPSLSYNCQNGMLPQRVIKDYYPPDIASAGYGALVVQPNAHYMENALMSVLEEKSNLQILTAKDYIGDAHKAFITEKLDVLPFTFEYEGMPSCWGKGFENYLSMEEYFAPHEHDATIEMLCSPIIEHIKKQLHHQDFSVETLKDNKGRFFTQGNFRTSAVLPKQTMLHVDDLQLDGKWKADFEMPETLIGNDYRQFSLLIFLKKEGDDATLRVYDKKYEATHERFKLENGWQFSEEVVKNCPYEDVQPQTGDVLLMNNHCFHDIIGGEKSSSWLLYSTYLVVLPDEKKVYLYI